MFKILLNIEIKEKQNTRQKTIVCKNLFLPWKRETSWQVGNSLFPKVSHYSHLKYIRVPKYSILPQ